jgi:chemotaxis response regulator CheB
MTIRQVLEGHFNLEVVGEAVNDREVTELNRRLCPELVLIDVRMPQMDGLAAPQSISEFSMKREVRRWKT